MNSIYNFLSLHSSAIEGGATLAFGWIIREIPVAYRSLQTNGGICGFYNVILHGQSQPSTTTNTNPNEIKNLPIPLAGGR